MKIWKENPCWYKNTNREEHVEVKYKKRKKNADENIKEKNKHMKIIKKKIMLT